MDRPKYMAKLEHWRTSPRKKPLLLEGARQVGKTWLMQEFARTHYANILSLRFDRNAQLKDIFGRDFDVSRILHELEVLFHTRIDSANTILLFDEIQSCPHALTSLKYFQEDRPDIDILAAGSLLGLTYRTDEPKDSAEPSTGFPVGKISTMPVWPMSFQEFLDALGEKRLADEIRNENWNLLRDFHEHLADHLRHYYVIGGMPEAVQMYVDSGNFLDVREIHREILAGYRRDFSKHAPKTDVRKIEMCWDSVPVQLARENKRFSYSALKRGGRASEFRDPLAWLQDAGLIHLNRRVSGPNLPLDGYVNGAFKVYALDVGLLSTLSGLDPAVILEGSRVFKEFKGALTEQYVYQQLIAETDLTPHYWSTEDSRTEVDFVFQRGMEVVPLEVKSEENVHSQSLKSYIRRFRPSCVYRASMLPYAEQQVPLDDSDGSCRLTNIPLYAVPQGLARHC